jgi:hypothetical protein
MDEELPPLPPETETPVPNATSEGASAAIPNLLRPFKVRHIQEHPSNESYSPTYDSSRPLHPVDLPTGRPVAAAPRQELQPVAGRRTGTGVTLLPPEPLVDEPAPLTLSVPQLPRLPGHSTEPNR